MPIHGLEQTLVWSRILSEWDGDTAFWCGFYPNEPTTVKSHSLVSLPRICLERHVIQLPGRLQACAERLFLPLPSQNRRYGFTRVRDEPSFEPLFGRDEQYPREEDRIRRAFENGGSHGPPVIEDRAPVSHRRQGSETPWAFEREVEHQTTHFQELARRRGSGDRRPDEQDAWLVSARACLRRRPGSHSELPRKCADSYRQKYPDRVGCTQSSSNLAYNRDILFLIPLRISNNVLCRCIVMVQRHQAMWIQGMTSSVYYFLCILPWPIFPSILPFLMVRIFPHGRPHKLGVGFFLVCSNFQRYGSYCVEWAGFRLFMDPH